MSSIQCQHLRPSRYKLDKETISKDLTTDRPVYILSAYGPGRDAPLQLFGGRPREQSFEELRTRHYELTSQGKQQEAIQEAQALVNTAEQQMKTALNDLDGAIKYISDGGNQHPNRIDICKARGQASGQSQMREHSQPAFGQTSGAPTFGQPAAPGGFGQPSSTPAHGQPFAPTPFGKPSIPAFGQPSTPNSAFTQAPRPAFGQPSIPASTFVQTNAPAFGRPATSFGQPSTVPGQASTQAPVFGQPSSQITAFRNPSIQASTFGQPSAQASAPTPPSVPSPFAGGLHSNSTTNAQQSNPFGAPQSSTFGQVPSLSEASAFASPSVRNDASPFSQPIATEVQAPIRQTSTLISNSSGTAAPFSVGGAFERPTTAAQSSFAQSSAQQPSGGFNTSDAINTSPSAPSANVTATRRPSIHLTRENPGQKDAQGKLRTWKGREVRYIDDNPHYREANGGEWQRIWFPDGPPTFTKIEDVPEAAYDATTRDKYKFAMENGRFLDGIIPIMPPRKEWCNWNF